MIIHRAKIRVVFEHKLFTFSKLKKLVRTNYVDIVNFTLKYTQMLSGTII